MDTVKDVQRAYTLSDKKNRYVTKWISVHDPLGQQKREDEESCLVFCGKSWTVANNKQRLPRGGGVVRQKSGRGSHFTHFRTLRILVTRRKAPALAWVC